MADEETGLPPLEIPWKLASTTQPLVAGEPDETALSIFFFEPAEEDLPPGIAPDERLVYLKFTASVSPAAFPPGHAAGGGWRARRRRALLPPAARSEGAEVHGRAGHHTAVFPRRGAALPPDAADRRRRPRDFEGESEGQ